MAIIFSFMHLNLACKQPKKIGPCRAGMKRWYYNRFEKKCEHFLWGGCAPNANNFATIEDCEKKCENNGEEKITFSFYRFYILLCLKKSTAFILSF